MDAKHLFFFQNSKMVISIKTKRSAAKPSPPPSACYYT